MKIAITGGTAGIGNAMGSVYESKGYEVLRLSRRNGHNIRSTNKIADVIESCDVFINNAQAGFAQTELLFEMAKRWTNTQKHIVSISTMMATDATCKMKDLSMSEYFIQKCALELAVKELRHKNLGLRLSIIRPGNIATSPEKTVPPAADVNEWARYVVETLDNAGSKFIVQDISVGPMI